MIDVWIPGDPVSQGRPRFVRRGRYMGAIDPERSRLWKHHARGYIREAMKDAAPLLGPLELSVLFVFSCPASHCAKPTKRNPEPAPTPRRWRESRPDIDNLTKAVMDASNGLIFEDDCQIVRLDARKVWGRQGEDAGVYMTVRSVQGEP